MIDVDDIGIFAMIFSPRTIPGFCLWVIGLIVLGVIVYNNANDCEQLQCKNGTTPRLMDGACLCVEAAE